jgi:hypothetical protein
MSLEVGHGLPGLRAILNAPDETWHQCVVLAASQIGRR